MFEVGVHRAVGEVRWGCGMRFMRRSFARTALRKANTLGCGRKIVGKGREAEGGWRQNGVVDWARWKACWGALLGSDLMGSEIAGTDIQISVDDLTD